MTDGGAQSAVSQAGIQRPELTAGLVLFTCFVFGLIGKGTVETFGVFLLPLTQEFGWARASITGIYAVTMLVAGLSGPIVGLLFDRWGARTIYAMGLLAMAGGFFLTSMENALWQFYLSLGAALGFGIACIGNVPNTALVGRWFSARMGSAMGVIWAATGLGTLILMPVAQMLIDAGGWRFASRMLALAVLTLGLLLAVMPWRAFSRGHPRPLAAEGAARSTGAGATPWTVRLALREPMLWAIFLVFFFTSVGVFGVQVQIVAYLVGVGVDPLTAATVVGFAGLAASAGQMLFGWLGDRMGRRFALTLSYTCTSIGLVALSALDGHPATWLLVVYVLTFGLTIGSRGPQIAAVAAKLFGGPSLGGIFGVLTIGMGLGSAIGSFLGGFLHDWTGGYQTGFVVSFVCILAALSPWWLWPSLREL
ncbi:MAG: MFS transporter [Proteobacteria bacterium]|nr:MFS transporter [Pseudomonadota bacterium]MBI3499108.1 MFS transporter [Pseudomonadota bacterium]